MSPPSIRPACPTSSSASVSSRLCDAPKDLRKGEVSRLLASCHRRVGAAPWEVTWKPSSSSAVPPSSWRWSKLNCATLRLVPLRCGLAGTGCDSSSSTGRRRRLVSVLRTPRHRLSARAAPGARPTRSGYRGGPLSASGKPLPADNLCQRTTSASGQPLPADNLCQRTTSASGQPLPAGKRPVTVVSELYCRLDGESAAARGVHRIQYSHRPDFYHYGQWYVVPETWPDPASRTLIRTAS